MDNVFFCCTQKTASQWLRLVLQDTAVSQASNMEVLPYKELGLKFASFDEAFPEGNIVAHLYIDYPTYRSIPKPASYRSFFVLRDPRDVVVSWYFSIMNTHKFVGPILELYNQLSSLERQAGMRYVIDRLVEWQSFEAQRSWVEAPLEDFERIFRYEDLSQDHRTFLGELTTFLGFDLGQDFEEFCQRHAFSSHTGGRNVGVEDRYSHYRKGKPGDYRILLDAETLDYFYACTGDLVEVLGYER